MVILMSDMNDKEKLTRQKQLLRKRLGLDMVGGVSMGEDLFQEEDLLVQKQETPSVTQVWEQLCHEFFVIWN